MKDGTFFRKADYVTNMHLLTTTTTTLKFMQHILFNDKLWKWLQFVFISITILTSSTLDSKLNAQCNLAIQMNDSFGDGWNGGYLEIFFDGVSQDTFAAVGTGSSANLTIPAGQTMTVEYNMGSWEGENTYTISIGGSVVFSDGPSPSTGMVYSYDCPGGGSGCADTEIVLTMNNSWGDGWNGAELTLTGDNGTSYGPYTITSGIS